MNHFTYVKLKKETSKSSSWGVLECARADGSHVAITSSKWPMAVTEMPKGLSLCGTVTPTQKEKDGRVYDNLELKDVRPADPDLFRVVKTMLEHDATSLRHPIERQLKKQDQGAALKEAVRDGRKLRKLFRGVPEEVLRRRFCSSTALPPTAQASIDRIYGATAR